VHPLLQLLFSLIVGASAGLALESLERLEGWRTRWAKALRTIAAVVGVIELVHWGVPFLDFVAGGAAAYGAARVRREGRSGLQSADVPDRAAPPDRPEDRGDDGC
jgi:hypothetical protein